MALLSHQERPNASVRRRPPGIASNEVSTCPEYFNFERKRECICRRRSSASTLDIGRFLTTREDLWLTHRFQGYGRPKSDIGTIRLSGRRTCPPIWETSRQLPHSSVVDRKVHRRRRLTIQASDGKSYTGTKEQPARSVLPAPAMLSSRSPCKSLNDRTRSCERSFS